MAILMKDGETFPLAKVTAVEVFPFNATSKLAAEKHLLGIATVVLNDQLIIRDLRVMDGENGMFVAYPLRDTKLHGSAFAYQSVVNPIKRELREHIEDVVLEEYQRQKGK